MVVVSRPSRAAYPLEPLGRAYDSVVGYGVAVCVVEVVCPFVDFFGPGLDDLFPRATASDECDAIGGEGAEYFVFLKLLCVLGYDQVYEIVGVGQELAVPLIDADGAVDSLLDNVGSGGGDVFCVGIETVDEVSIAGAQGCCELAVGAAEVDDQAAFDAGELEQLGGVLGRCRRR